MSQRRKSSAYSPPTLHILGTRGIPARHGGFETFAQRLALFLVERGWRVIVYCQGTRGPIHSDSWRGVERVHIPSVAGSAGSVLFDLRSVWRAAREPGAVLILGYNTALFNLLLNVRRRAYAVNMDGIEWRRRKWSAPWKAWFFVSEAIARRASTTLIADHPEIARHLASRSSCRDRIETIAYGADCVTTASPEAVVKLGVSPGQYGLIIARPEPENSILEMVQAWSSRPRGRQLVVLGDYNTKDSYAAAVRSSASNEVVFPGAIYDQETVASLRLHARVYLYGHTVGGTSPTLVEAMGAGLPIVALDTPYPTWVTGDGSVLFRDLADLDRLLTQLLPNEARLKALAAASRARHTACFQWEQILSQYETLLLRMVGCSEV